MFGFRPEGRRVKGMDPIVSVTPYLMPQRCDAQVFLTYDADFSTLTEYVARKSREGFKVTFMEIIIAAFVRGVSQVPEVNRFIANKQLFNRKELTTSLTVLMDTTDGKDAENVVKVWFDPSDTIYDVSARMKNAIEEGRKESDPGFAIHLAKFALSVPFLPSILAFLVKLLDRYGLLPKALLDALPFHTSMFITNLASIGLTRAFHHIYNFGNTSFFIAMGASQRSYTVDAKGNPKRQCILPLGIVVDERVCGGSVYAKLFAVMKKSLSHPELLELPPENVYYNVNAEYHVPKPENVFVPQNT